jgi:tetrahydromethanopterin S-methyltransferase subunit B
MREREWLWTGIGKLNSLRNDVVHHMEPKKAELYSAPGTCLRPRPGRS